MISILVVSPIMGGPSFRAQASPAGVQTAQVSDESSFTINSQIPPDKAVITLLGLCHSIPLPVMSNEDFQSVKTTTAPTATGPDCQTIVTRQELEDLASATGVKPGNLLALAYQYADLLQFATKGHELGVEKDLLFQQKAKYTYLQAMAQYAVVAMQREANDFTDADLKKYYAQHPERFVQVDLFQLAVPKRKVHVDSAGNPIAQSKETLAADEAEMKTLAARLQKEASAGADFDRLEERAYKSAFDDSVPSTNLGTRFEDMVSPEYRKLIFDLHEGQVSQLAEDSREYLIFKIRNKHMLPLAESRHWYGQLVMRDMRNALAAGVKVEYDDQYFPPINKPNARGDEFIGIANHQ